MGLSIGGLISGFDTESIISQLLDIERRPILQLQQREGDYQVQLTAYGSLQSVLSSLKAASVKLDNTGSLTGFSATSGDTDIFTASADDSATVGSYNITVEQLALAHKVKSTAFTETEEVLEFKVTANTNDKIDFTENTGGGANTRLATLDEGYYTVSELETEIETKMEAASAYSVDYTVSYDSSTKKFTIEEDGSILTATGLELLWNTGANNAKSVATTLGYDNTADDTGATTYSGDNDVGEGTIHLEIGNVFTIGSANNKIDFYEDGTFENTLVATLTEGNYTVSELEAEIKTQLEAASDGAGSSNNIDYTVSYDNSTQKFTIAESTSDLDELQLLWGTGDNAAESTGALLGFSAEDDEGGTSHTADSQVGVVTDISISATDTIEDVADAINDADAGVQAAVIFDGTNYYLTLTAEDSGKANVINLMVTDIDGDNTDNTNGLSRLVYHEGGTTNLEETQDAKDSIIYVDGVEDIYRSTNTIDDVIEGVTITLKDVHADPPNESDTLAVSRNTSTVVSAVNGFVSAYNNVLDFFEDYQEYDQETETAAVLFGDSTTTMIRNRLANRVADMVPGVESFDRLADLGVTLNDEGELEVDSSTLNDALDDHFDDVLQFFTQTTEGSEGFGVRMVDALEGFLDSYDGILTARTSGIEDSIDDIQDKVESLTARMLESETRLRARFNALEALLGVYQATSDYLMAQITGFQNLSSYISGR